MSNLFSKSCCLILTSLSEFLQQEINILALPLFWKSYEILYNCGEEPIFFQNTNCWRISTRCLTHWDHPALSVLLKIPNSAVPWASISLQPVQSLYNQIICFNNSPSLPGWLESICLLQFCLSNYSEIGTSNGFSLHDHTLLLVPPLLSSYFSTMPTPSSNIQDHDASFHRKSPVLPHHHLSCTSAVSGVLDLLSDILCSISKVSIKL